MKKLILAFALTSALFSCKKETNTKTTTTNIKATTITYNMFDEDGKIIRDDIVQVQNEDLYSILINYSQVKNEISKLSDGWRIPTHAELKGMYLKRDTIGGFKDSTYWGLYDPLIGGSQFLKNDVKSLPTCTFSFKTGKLTIDKSLSSKNTNCYLRLVRDLKYSK